MTRIVIRSSGPDTGLRWAGEDPLQACDRIARTVGQGCRPDAAASGEHERAEDQAREYGADHPDRPLTSGVVSGVLLSPWHKLQNMLPVPMSLMECCKRLIKIAGNKPFKTLIL